MIWLMATVASDARGLNLLDYVVVAGYLASMLFMGYYFSRGQSTSEEYFVGRRRMPAPIVGLSLVATLLSTITYLAAPGDMIQHGLVFATQILSVPLWLTVVALVFVPFFMRYRLTSIYEYAAMRFGSSTRLAAAALFVSMRFGWMGMVIYTCSDAVALMTGNLPEALIGRPLEPSELQTWLYVVMTSLGLVATIYTFLGGIRVVIWTDAVQFLVMMGGALFAVVYVWVQTGDGPIAWWQHAPATPADRSFWFTFDLRVERTAFLVVLNAFFWRLCTHCSDQVTTQRYFSTDGSKSAVRSNLYGAAGDFCLTGTLALVGLALVAFFHGQFDPQSATEAKQAFPTFIINYLPHGLAGLLMAALFAAAMSSVDSGINSLSAVVTTDFYHALKLGPEGSRAEFRIARTVTLVAGVAITLVAYFIAWAIAVDERNKNIIDLSVRVFNLFLGPLGAIFLVGMFLPWVGRVAMNVAIATGMASAIGLGYAREWGALVARPLGAMANAAGDWDPPAATLREWSAAMSDVAGPSALLVTPLATLITCATAALLGAFLPAPAPEQVVGHTWWSRHRLREPVERPPD